MTGVLLLAAAAGAYLIFKNGGAPSVDYKNIDWLNGTALITINGTDQYLNTGQGIAIGDYTVTLDKNYWPSSGMVEPTQLVLRKSGAIQRVIAQR